MTVARVRPTWVPVAVVGAGALVVVALVVFARAVLTRDVDLPAERWAVAHRSPDVTAVLRAWTWCGDPTVVTVGLLLLAGLAAVLRRPRTALVAVLADVARSLVSVGLKHAVGRPRPQLSQLVTASGSSFPSGHALGATLLWGGLVVVLAGCGAGVRARTAAAVLCPLLVAGVMVSRVYLGVHWPSDVVGGALLGATVLLALARACRVEVEMGLARLP